MTKVGEAMPFLQITRYISFAFVIKKIKMNADIKNNIVSENEVSISDFFRLVKRVTSLIRKKVYTIFFIAFLGGISGIIYAYFQPVTYSAKMTFVVEDGKSSTSGLGGLASIAGQFGVDLGGNNSGVLSGDNIMLYFKSQSLIKEVLLDKFDSLSNTSIADQYIKVYKLNSKWAENGVGENFKIFKRNINNKEYRKQDSILINIISDIQKNNLTISKTDKKGTFIDVVSSMRNEKLSKVFCEKIVNIAISRYLNIKTERQRVTVEKLQKRVDSIGLLLNARTQTSANLQTSMSTMDINPLYKTNSLISNEVTLRDKTLLATIFASVTQNLEIAKFTLSQETPVIQIIDTPLEPLIVKKSSKILSGLSAAFASVFFYIFLILYKELRKKNLFA